MSLDTYRKKRNFGVTPEPRGRTRKSAAPGLLFIVQKHRASHLHYDFRLELDGVLLSWAVPKGPSVDPADKRLAMHTEDHPIEYGGFEGVIPAGEYGGGTVLLWDRGVWMPEGDPREGYRKGKLKFRLEGDKLKGGWTLVRAHGARNADGKSWFLIKADDEHARRGEGARLVTDATLSVASGRDLDEIAADPDRVWHSNRSVADNVRAGEVKKRKPRLALAKVRGARKATLPVALTPQLATLAKAPPRGAGWVHEIKYDGYRMVCRIAGNEARMYSRNGKEWTAQFAPIARALGRLPVREAWIDGEVVVMQADGRTSFQALQNALSTGDTSRMVFWAFDLPHVDGYDLSHAPLTERKRVLKQILEGQPAVLRYSEHLDGPGEAVHGEACRLGLEGIVSKRADAPYRSRRGSEWLKVKCAQRQEMVIGGYTDPRGSRTGFGALLLGVHDTEGKLRYCGKVGTGFDDATLGMLAPILARKERARSPFADPPTGYEAKGAHWVTPDLVAEIAFTEWTRDGTVRHPSFQGLREDKKARDVVLERPVDADALATPDAKAQPAGPTSATTDPPAGRAKTGSTRRAAATSSSAAAGDRASAGGRAAAGKGSGGRAARAAGSATPDAVAGIAISHPDKVLYPEAGFTKRDLARYYEAIGEWMLPHVAGRPLTLVRCPEGWERPCFFQKHAKAGTPQAVEKVEVPEGNGGTATYMMANTVPALVALLQMGVLEFHVWGSRQPHLDRPDRLVFDFDPDEDLGWETLVEGVDLLRTLLDNVGLRGFVKTTGGKGLHVVVPVKPVHDWDVVKRFTKAMADLLVQASPARFTSNLAKSHRGGKIFIDYLRNAEGATAVAAYSARAKAGAPVSTPIAWEELDRDVRFAHFNIRNVPRRLARLKRDPWQGFDHAGGQAMGDDLLARLGIRPR